MNRAGRASGRALHSVHARFHMTSVKPAPSKSAATDRNGSSIETRPSSRRKPSMSATRPVTSTASAGSGNRLLWSGRSVSTGMNWPNAPHIVRLSQPIVTRWTTTSVAGALKASAGKPSPADIMASAASSDSSATAKYNIVQRESTAPINCSSPRSGGFALREGCRHWCALEEIAPVSDRLLCRSANDADSSPAGWPSRARQGKELALRAIGSIGA